MVNVVDVDVVNISMDEPLFPGLVEGEYCGPSSFISSIINQMKHIFFRYIYVSCSQWSSKNHIFFCRNLSINSKMVFVVIKPISYDRFFITLGLGYHGKKAK